MTSLVGVGRAVDVVYLHFSKAFSIVSHDILTNELMMYRPDKYVAKWTGNWLNCQTQKGCDQGHKAQLEASH